MAFGVGSDTPTYELVPAGDHNAICYGMVELGTQPENYDNKPRMVQKVQLLFEIPDKTNREGKPFSIGAMLTNSDDPKSNLYKWLVKWRGRDFTAEEKKSFKLVNVVGAGVRLEVIHKNKQGGATGDKIESVRKLPEGTKMPPLSRQKIVFQFSDWKQEVFDALPQWMKTKIINSPEYKARQSSGGQSAQQTSGDAGQGDYDSSIPF